MEETTTTKTSTDVEHVPFDPTPLKRELNNAVLMYGPGNVTISQAEKAMCLCVEFLERCNRDNANNGIEAPKRSGGRLE